MQYMDGMHPFQYKMIHLTEIMLLLGHYAPMLPLAAQYRAMHLDLHLSGRKATAFADLLPAGGVPISLNLWGSTAFCQSPSRYAKNNY